VMSGTYLRTAHLLKIDVDRWSVFLGTHKLFIFHIQYVKWSTFLTLDSTQSPILELILGFLHLVVTFHKKLGFPPIFPIFHMLCFMRYGESLSFVFRCSRVLETTEWDTDTEMFLRRSVRDRETDKGDRVGRCVSWRVRDWETDKGDRVLRCASWRVRDRQGRQNVKVCELKG
jgi:hypothetical protein